jgi:hypothetical protein
MIYVYIVLAGVVEDNRIIQLTKILLVLFIVVDILAHVGLIMVSSKFSQLTPPPKFTGEE